MNFTFLRSTGEVAFFRSDAEQADWTQEEFSLHCLFPYVADKVIERGMVVLFQNPATDDWQAYEIRQCEIYPGDYYQQFTAEDIAVSELTDCHVQENKNIEGVTASSALTQILIGTGWNIGTIETDPSSMGSFSRGSVWQNVNMISENWNIYIMPRVTVGQDGITGRFLDIISPAGTFRGLRLAVNKNLSDPCVTYDDSEMYTALYAYGGTYSIGSTSDRQTKEYNIGSVVWEKTNDHPAKPFGQLFLEWPEKTALYGRNGKPRFGYYQNTNIKDPNILIEKTWETLKQCSDPKISISGTVIELKRLGYKDQPLRLHDMAIIELEPVGILLYKQIIQLTVDLLNHDKNLPTIGDYIPNIIYINRDTEKTATGGSKGTGNGGGKTKVDLEFDKYRTDIYDTGKEVGMYARIVDEQGNILQQAGMKIDPETGVLIYAEDTENNIGSKFRVQSNRITAEVNERTAMGNTLSSRITQTSNQISLEVSERKAMGASLQGKIDVQANKIGLVVTQKDGHDVVNAASIVLGINNQDKTSQSYVDIQADKINLSGYVTASQLNATNAEITNLKTGATTAAHLKATIISASNLEIYQRGEVVIPSSADFKVFGYGVSFKTITINGSTYHLLGYGGN